MNHLTAMVYVSTAHQEFSQAELESLLQNSRRNNKKAGITGMLLYKDCQFMQLLEGPYDELLATFDKIEQDPRHHSVQVLMKVRLDKRNFERWAMGFEYLGELSTGLSANFDDIWTTPFSSEYFGTQPHNALRLLLNFRKKMKPTSGSQMALPSVSSVRNNDSSRFYITSR